MQLQITPMLGKITCLVVYCISCWPLCGLCVSLLTDGASAVKSSQIDIVSHGDHQQVGLQADACMLFHT